jgi:hypothetical protein
MVKQTASTRRPFQPGMQHMQIVAASHVKKQKKNKIQRSIVENPYAGAKRPAWKMFFLKKKFEPGFSVFV